MIRTERRLDCVAFSRHRTATPLGDCSVLGFCFSDPGNPAQRRAGATWWTH